MSPYVYIAAPWELQDQAKRLAAILREAGVQTTASWLHAQSECLTDEWARNCLRDIRQCDVLVAWNPEDWARGGTGGRHFEAGFASALAKPLVVVGARTHIFHFLRTVDHVAIDGDMLTNLQRIFARLGFAPERG